VRVRAALLAIALSAGPAPAELLEKSPTPVPRPAAEPTPQPAAVPVTMPVRSDADIRPRPRPDRPTVRQMQPAVSAGSALAIARLPQAGLARSPLPKPRPERALRRSERPLSSDPARVLRSGKVGPICGSSDIIGQRVDPIPGRLEGCGIANPVRVAEVAGIRLSRGTTMDCATARVFRSWVEGGLKPAVGRLGGGPARIDVAAGYACRTINSRRGGSISEHGKGNAIDISGITLRNGKRITVEDGWRRQAEGKVLRRLHRAACGPFGTVLGPGADRFHQDHFHFDIKRRNSPYCR